MRFWSREPVMASVEQWWRDSAQWAVAADSLRRVLAARGATQLDCPERVRWRAPGQLVSEHWLEGQFALSIHGSRIFRTPAGQDYELTVRAVVRPPPC